MPIDWQKILEIAPLLLTKPGSVHGAAMMRGFQESMQRKQHEDHQRQQQAQQLALQQQTQQRLDEQFRLQQENTSADNARADAQLQDSREQRALARIVAYRHEDATRLGALTQTPERMLHSADMPDVSAAALKMTDRPPNWSQPDEQKFGQWWADISQQTGLAPNPDDPEHKYNYRYAFRAGDKPDAETAHWPSTYKTSDHSGRYVGETDSITGQPITPAHVGQMTLPQFVRWKHTGVYDDWPDNEIVADVLARRPDFQREYEQAKAGSEALSAQNNLTVKRFGAQQDYGVPAGTPQGPLPDMTQAVSNRDKRLAQQVLDRIDKHPLYAGYQGKPELESLSVQFKDGQTKKVSELRALAGGMLLGPDGVPVPPMPKMPAAHTVTPGSFEEYVGAPPERQAVIRDARKAYMQADDRPLVVKPAPPAGTLPAQTQRRVDAKAKGFDSQAVVKNTQKMAEAVSFAKSLDPNTTNPADDQAIIYAFAKAMDPDSVVREGEYATVQKYAQSWAQTFGFNAARVFSNTSFLTPQARQNMKNTITKKYAAGKAQYDNVRKSYAKQIDQITGEPGSGETWLVDYAGAFPDAGGAEATGNPADEALKILEQRRKGR